MITVSASATYREDPPIRLQNTKELRAWFDSLPEGCDLQAINHDFGSQRDPAREMVGIHATWKEQR